ncbi:AAA family ATPase [Paenibacillus sp. JX-17]|uniref:Nuclease SbcCD subunit C n=1 Tax=Paenibacillus lacisoli TaxID=3064525 RepID=A0ABT9CGQ4_9BACL|nr:AAA family ATPase [Paenibacillus sp. JX-17]MDO7908463.1 AAA family ATPase [Paenibacillus sp. JX-17]
MRSMILEQLTLRNFKGFREFTLTTQQGNVSAFGDNATGKTTLFDAFIWLMFGKDSQNRTDFEIKGLDTTGRVLQHKLEHEVEGVFLIDGVRRTFRRVFSEKWTRKRGAVTEEHTGHTTDYYVDGVPQKEKDYKAEIDAIIQEDLFKLLTSPSFFNEQLDKKKRRQTLLDVCGDLTDAEVIHSNPDLAELPAILGDRELEKHRMVIVARMSAINKEIKELPIRISEAHRNMPDVSGLNQEQLEADLHTLRNRLESRETEVSRIVTGGEVSVKQKRMREIEGELLDIKNRLQESVLQKVTAQRDEVNQLHMQRDQLRRKIDDNQHRIKQNEASISQKEREAARLRTDWTAENGQQLDEQHDENCPSCGQALPADQIAEAHTKALEQFNLKKSERLEVINKQGKGLVEEIKQLQSNTDKLQQETSQLSDQIADIQTNLTHAESVLQELRAGMQDPTADPSYQQLQQEKAVIQQEIEQLTSSAQEAAAAVRTEIQGLRTEIETLERRRVQFDGVKKAQQRIDELEQQERQLSAEHEQLQKELFLVEEFTRTKTGLLENRINSKFKYARFRLFRDLVNGGQEEVCDTLYEGVPYDKGLNNAARINVGLDIINTLGEHYGFSAPIFVDNAEAVTKLIDTQAQVIRLVVSEADKKIRVVHDDLPIQEAI